jgi:PTS system beta-glucosides-specific IIC component
VKKGDLLVEVDLEKTKEEGYDMIVPVVILNTEEYAEVKAEAGGTVDHGEAIIKIKK